MFKQVKLSIALYLLSALVVSESFANNYKVNSGITGTITSVGSDTMSNLVSVWAEEFEEIYPQVSFQLQASGSSTAPPAMIQGTANIGPMSRGLKSSERLAFIDRYGFEPMMVPVGLDAIILFVDLDNPVNSINQSQIDSMFSITRYCGGAQSLEMWSQIPKAVSFPYRVRLFGRSAVSGTYGLFKSKVLCNGDFKPSVAELPSSSSIVQSVAFFKGAIGYAAWGFQYSGVKLLSIQGRDSKQAVIPSEDNIRNSSYPFTRTLYLMVNKEDGRRLDDPVYEFIRFILSKQGDQLTRREGYVPLAERQKQSIINGLKD